MPKLAWNSGIFLFSRGVLLEALLRHLPDLAICLPMLNGSRQAPFLNDPLKVQAVFAVKKLI
ncbi:MAG: hypothetical protein PHU44_17980 [Syntrophales bacterium]|nr:hypothetical protein [Syntrophales bacterium]